MNDRSIAMSADETCEALERAARAARAERDLLEEQVIDAHLPLADRIAGRYNHRGVDLDDLRQVARCALVMAVRRFDPDRGAFVSFAAATMSGEVKKYFRDHGWMVRPPRSVQDLQAAMARAEESHHHASQGTLGIDDLAGALDVRREAVVDAELARGCFTTASLDAAAGHGRTVGDTLAGDSHELDLMEDWIVFRPAWDLLDPAERRLLALRFFDDLTQDAIAQIVGLSQMQVSRRLKAVITKLRDEIPLSEAV